jgi:hypothetical protein
MSTNDAATDLVSVDTEPASRSHATPASTAVKNRQTAEYASMRRVMNRFA